MPMGTRYNTLASLHIPMAAVATRVFFCFRIPIEHVITFVVRIPVEDDVNPMCLFTYSVG